MNSKFKEFRKLLQSSPIVSAPETFLGRDPKVSETPWIFEQLPSTNSAETRDALTAQRSPQVELHAEQVTDNGDVKLQSRSQSRWTSLVSPSPSSFSRHSYARSTLLKSQTQPTLSTGLPDQRPSSSSRSRIFAITCRGFRDHSRRCARFRTISVYLLSRTSRATAAPTGHPACRRSPNPSYGSGGVTGTSQCLAGAGRRTRADSGGRYGTPGPILRAGESDWGCRSEEQ
jgi:hypothetical protein